MKKILALLLLASTLTLAGPVDGPQSNSTRVPSASYDTYRLAFYGGVTAGVAISGDGDTDLDLYVYDNNDNLICSSTSYGDDESCIWTPSWTGTFRIKIINRGNVYNQYTIVVR